MDYSMIENKTHVGRKITDVYNGSQGCFINQYKRKGSTIIRNAM